MPTAEPASTPRPWGLRRMEPYANTELLSYTHVGVDPVTQTGVYLDPCGRPIEAGRHGTGTDTKSATGTNFDGKSDSDTNPDGDQD